MTVEAPPQRRTCDAKLRVWEKARDGLPPVYCRQSVGLVSFEDRAGIIRYACKPHIGFVVRMYGQSHPHCPECGNDILHAMGCSRAE